MKEISAAAVIEKNQVASATPFLITLEIEVVDSHTFQVVDTVYLVRNTENLVIGGIEHVAVAFELEVKAESGAIPEVSVRIEDLTRTIQARMQDYGGGVGSRVKIGVVVGSALAAGPELTEFFSIQGAQTQDYVVTWSLGAENPLTQVFPRRNQYKDRCGWAYRDVATCDYTGPLPSCDLTLKGPNGCVAHGNARNYGGFPGLGAGASYG